jgi:hypothetical protein
MRREFYDHQYGGDEYCIRNKTKLPISASAASGALSPTSVSETNILTNNVIKTNNISSASCAPNTPPPPLTSKPNSRTHTPAKVAADVTVSSNGQEVQRSLWAATNNVNKTLETQITTDDGETDDGSSAQVDETITWSAI